MVMKKRMVIPVRVKTTIRYPRYTCACGRNVIPMSNPSRCPYCGRITTLR